MRDFYMQPKNIFFLFLREKSGRPWEDKTGRSIVGHMGRQSHTTRFFFIPDDAVDRRKLEIQMLWQLKALLEQYLLSNVYIFDTKECSKNIRANYNLLQFTNKASSHVVIL